MHASCDICWLREIYARRIACTFRNSESGRDRVTCCDDAGARIGLQVGEADLACTPCNIRITCCIAQSEPVHVAEF